uniref:HEAT repeat-containing protein 4 n=1 Tax=Varanus komodoensis TaxID=61221 RepID=A0A8D2IQE9_VARKO
MEVSAFFKSKNPFPLESSLKFKVERKNLPSHNAMVSSARATLPLIYQNDVCRAKWHYACYKKECFKKVAQDLHFAKDVVKHRVPSAVPYKEYNHMHLYDFSSFMQPQVNVKIISKKQPRKLKPLRRVPFRMKSDIASTKHVTTTNAPVSLEESIWKAREESTFAEPHLLVPIPSPPPPPPPPLPPTSKFTTIRGTTVPELEHKDLGWEEKLLTKLSKATAQWIVNNQPSWGGWIQGKPQGFKRQKYDWNSIRYVLPFERDVELLDEIQAEENVVESCIQSQEAKQQEMPLPAYYRVLRLDDPTARNQTADIIPEKSLKPVFPIKHHERLNSRVGKYSYTTQNVFEQDLYFGRTIFQRVQKGAIHWTAPPTLIEDFAKTGEVQLSVPPGKKRKCQRRPEEDVPEEILIRRTMLQQWKAAWKYDPRWQSATIEGLIRDLVDVHVHNRINAILMCASAVLEQSQVFTTEDIPERIQPLLRNTLFDKDAHVRMAAAVCFYAIGQSNENAQAIMKDALLNGEDSDFSLSYQTVLVDTSVSKTTVTFSSTKSTQMYVRLSP